MNFAATGAGGELLDVQTVVIATEAAIGVRGREEAGVGARGEVRDAVTVVTATETEIREATVIGHFMTERTTETEGDATVGLIRSVAAVLTLGGVMETLKLATVVVILVGLRRTAGSGGTMNLHLPLCAKLEITTAWTRVVILSIVMVAFA